MLMSHPTDRPLRAGLAIALGMALVGAPLGGVAAGNLSGSAEFRLAQGAPKAGAPKAQAQQQAPEQGVERQISELRKRLNITPQQQPQFDAFAQAMRQNAQTMEPLAQQQQGASHNAVEDLKAAAKFAEAEADALKRLLPPLQALYDSLSDQQKKTADQVLVASAGGDQPPPPPQSKKR
jgi:periplasmic protein CpxP/Spy